MNRFLVYPTHETKNGNLQFPEENVMCNVDISDKLAAFHVTRMIFQPHYFVGVMPVFLFYAAAVFVKPTVSPVFTSLLPEASAL